VLVKWLSEIDENNRERFLLQTNMSQVLAAIVFSIDKDTQNFVKKCFIVSKDTEHRIREVLKNCKNMIQIAVKWEHVFNGRKLCSDFLFERMRKRLSLDEVKRVALQCSWIDKQFMKTSVENIQLSSFFASTLSQDELHSLVWSSDPGHRIGYFCRDWGKDPCLKDMLKLRLNFGNGRKKSLFQSMYFPDGFKMLLIF